MEQNMQPNNQKTHLLLWILIAFLVAIIMFIGGYLLANGSKKSQPDESVELKNPTTVEESAAAVVTQTPEPTTQPAEATEIPALEEPHQIDAVEEVIIDADALANATVESAPAQSDGIIYQADVYEYLTLRSAPSTSASALSLLPPYTRMQIVEHSNATMARVYLIDSRQEGYVNTEYISPEGSVMKRAGKKPSVTISDSTIYYADVHDSLTLRASASTSASATGTLPPFAAMYVIERNGKMAYVYAVDSGMTGWVNTDYITSNPNNFTRAGRNAPASASAGSLYWADVNEFLTLRDAPRTSGNEITTIPRGAVVTVLEWTNSEFCYVRYETAHATLTGYVMSKYLVPQ